MAAKIAHYPYTTERFNALSMFEETVQPFDKVGGTKFVNEEMQPLFRKHDVEEKFGLAILHRHFALKGSDRMVDVRGTSTPWKASVGTPSVWGFSKDLDSIGPLKFHLESDSPSAMANSDPSDPTIEAFLWEFRAILAQTGTQQIFGLCTYPGNDYPRCLEITNGIANINLTLEEAERLKLGGGRDVRFFFSDAFIKRGGCRCRCGERNSSHTGHLHYITHQ